MQRHDLENGKSKDFSGIIIIPGNGRKGEPYATSCIVAGNCQITPSDGLASLYVNGRVGSRSVYPLVLESKKYPSPSFPHIISGENGSTLVRLMNITAPIQLTVGHSGFVLAPESYEELVANEHVQELIDKFELAHSYFTGFQERFTQ